MTLGGPQTYHYKAWIRVLKQVYLLPYLGHDCLDVWVKKTLDLLPAQLVSKQNEINNHGLKYR